jgi:hypothetical protein
MAESNDGVLRRTSGGFAQSILELFAARDFVEPPFQAPPLVRCLFEHLKKAWFDAEFRNSEAAFIGMQKKQESERLGIQTAGWTGKKRDVLPFSDIPRGRSNICV